MLINKKNLEVDFDVVLGKGVSSTVYKGNIVSLDLGLDSVYRHFVDYVSSATMSRLYWYYLVFKVSS
jgi:hypothetical protein